MLGAGFSQTADCCKVGLKSGVGLAFFVCPSSAKHTESLLSLPDPSRLAFSRVFAMIWHQHV